MSTSQRLGRGFHRLALVLAAIPSVFGTIFSIHYAYQETGPALRNNPTPVTISRSDKPKDGTEIEVKGIGVFSVPEDFKDMSLEKQSETVQRLVAPWWWAKFAELLTIGLVTTLAVSFIVYGIVRAIGWVIGGFAAS